MGGRVPLRYHKYFLRYQRYLELRDSYYELHGLQRSRAGRNAFFYKRSKSENMRPSIKHIPAFNAQILYEYFPLQILYMNKMTKAVTKIVYMMKTWRGINRTRQVQTTNKNLNPTSIRQQPMHRRMSRVVKVPLGGVHLHIR